jgi:hypothetical protein
MSSWELIGIANEWIKGDRNILELDDIVQTLEMMSAICKKYERETMERKILEVSILTRY